MATQKKQTPTIASLQAELKLKDKELDNLFKAYNDQIQEFRGLKISFDMVKENFEREKTRLDQALKAALNISERLK